MLDYLQGKLSGKYAHEIEREMLRDPFVQEAMEGFDGMSSDDLPKDIQSLKEKISGKQSGSGVWLRIAATVSLLIVALSAVWYLSLDVATHEQLSYQESDSEYYGPSPESETSPPRIPEKTEEKESAPEQEQKVKAASQEDSYKPVAARVTQTPVEQEMKVEPLVTEEMAFDFSDDNDTEDLVFEDAMPAEEIALEEVVVEGKAPNKKMMTSSSAVVSRSAGASRSFTARTVSGLLTDETGEPIPGVTVVVKGTSVGTVTDLEGNYQIEVDGENTELTYSFIGYEPVTLKVGDRQVLDVELETDVQALSEVVVVGYGTEGSTEDISYQSANPINGMKAYKEYLETELRYPREALESGVEGKVILKATILTNGEIGAIDVKRSLGFGCDEEAIRLVRSGAQWLPAKENGLSTESQVRIKVKFDLPK